VLVATDRDIRIATLRLLEEKKRRMRDNGIRYYIPQVQQMPFHLSTKRIRAIFGGNRSGKTVAGATEAVWYSTGTHPYKDMPVPNFGRIVGTDFVNGIERVILPEIKKFMPKSMLVGGSWDKAFSKENKTLTLINGSTIEFMSYDQDIDKFESASRHWIWHDEEPPHGIWKANQVRLLDTRGDAWLTMTPIKGMTWVYDEIYEQAGIKKNIEIFVLDTYDNPYVDNEALDDLVDGLDSQEKEARIGGKFVQMSGLIYKEYNPEIHNIGAFPIPKHWPRVQSIDPHPRIPTVAVYVAVAPVSYFIAECYKNNIKIPENLPEGDVYIVYDEVYPDESLLISETAELMHAKEGKDARIVYRLIDNSANTPDPILGTTIKREFEKYGIRTILAQKDIPNRIFAVRAKLKGPSLFFMSELVPKTMWELRHYAWDDYKIGKDYKDPKEKPKKKRDHAMDNLGYICMSKPKYDLPKVYRPDRGSADNDTGYMWLLIPMAGIIWTILNINVII